MKKIIILPVLFLSLVASISAQELDKIAEIEVSSTKKVFTFRTIDNPKTEVDDTQKESSLTISQSTIIANFLSIQGVKSASFDKATGTYTVVADINTIIELPFKQEK